MSTQLNERLAIVETQIHQILEEGERREALQSAVLTKIEQVQTQLTNLNNDISRYKGFVGGIAFILSCMGVFLTKYATLIWQMFTAKGNG